MIYDQIVLGNGADAVSAALGAARSGERVALALAAASLELPPRLLQPLARRILAAGTCSLPALAQAVRAEISRSIRSAEDQMQRGGIDVFPGAARVLDAQTIVAEAQRLSGRRLVLACGTLAAPIGRMAWDRQQVVTPDGWLNWSRVPESAIVVGAGAVGLDRGMTLALLGGQVTLVDDHSSIFDLCDGLMNAPLLEAQSLPIQFRLGEDVIGVELRQTEARVIVRTASGRALSAESVIVCAGTRGKTAGLGLEEVGVGLDERGRIWCDASGQTWVPGIHAIGEVVGFRSLDRVPDLQAADAVDGEFEIVRHRGLERLPLLGDRVRERDFRGVQRLAADVR